MVLCGGVPVGGEYIFMCADWADIHFHRRSLALFMVTTQKWHNPPFMYPPTKRHLKGKITPRAPLNSSRQRGRPQIEQAMER